LSHWVEPIEQTATMLCPVSWVGISPLVGFVFFLFPNFVNHLNHSRNSS
jgi:sterol desaturase/sphingolipid hydroxylase (fatty acid hydroxylase superfamily)